MHRLSLGPPGEDAFPSGTVFMLCSVAACALAPRATRPSPRVSGGLRIVPVKETIAFSPSASNPPESWLENPGGAGAEPPRHRLPVAIAGGDSRSVIRPSGETRFCLRSAATSAARRPGRRAAGPRAISASWGPGSDAYGRACGLREGLGCGICVVASFCRRGGGGGVTGGLGGGDFGVPASGCWDFCGAGSEARPMAASQSERWEAKVAATPERAGAACWAFVVSGLSGSTRRRSAVPC